MEVHQLRYFCAVARHGTFTRASEAERVAQPSLSQQILKLEAELGARLFDRLPRRAKLTVFGRAFLPKAERILRELDEARKELHDMTGAGKGEVVVGVIPTVAPYLLPRFLKDFTLHNPNVVVNLIEDITPALLDRLQQGTIDMAIVALPISGNDLASITLLHEPMYAVLPEKHRLARSQDPISLAELDREPFLLLKAGHCFRDSLIGACKQLRMSPNIVLESGQFATILAMVSAGMGVSAVPAMAAEPRPGCKFIPISDPHSRRTVGIVRSRSRHKNRAEEVLIQQLRAACKRMQGA